MNTQLIQDIILSVLETPMGLMDNAQNREQREAVAYNAAQALTLASLEQLAALMGTNLSYDSEGQVIIFTGVYDQSKEDDIAQSDKDYWMNFASDDVNPTEVP